MSKKDKKAFIAEAAFDLFAERGYKNTKIIDIAKRAGIGKGTIYEYYDSKEDIFIVSIGEKVKSDYKVLINQLSKQKTAKDKIKLFLDFEMCFIRTYGTYASEITLQKLSEPDSNFTEKMHQAISEILNIEYTVMHSIIQEGITTGEIKDTSVPLASCVLVSIIYTYCLFKCGMTPIIQANAIAYEEILKDCDEEDVFDLIFYGLFN